MNLRQKIVYFYTRTPLHVGSGNTLGPIDLPIQREIHTGYPIIPGSSIKGALAGQPHYFEQNEDGGCIRTKEARKFFGHEQPNTEDGKAGAISFSEAKLLAFPVRSAMGCFAWLTAPTPLGRWLRIKGETQPDLSGLETEDGKKGGLFDSGKLGATAVFEDYAVRREDNFPAGTGLESVIDDPLWTSNAAKHLACVDDDLFAHYTRTACEIAPHVKIDPESGTAAGGALFFQENVPGDTLMYSIFTELRPGIFDEFEIPTTLQLGADSTTGLGFCSVFETEIRTEDQA